MGTYVFAGAAPVVAGSNSAAASSSGGLFRMDMADGKWTALGKGLPDKVEARSIVVQPGAADTVYVGTQDGPYRSTDGGETWTRLNLPGDNRLVWSILIHPRDPETLYVGTQGTQVFRSRDGGMSWAALDVPEPRGMVKMSFPCRVIRLALDPEDADTLYAAFEVGGLSRSTDGGETWQGCNDKLLEFTRQDRFKSRIVSDTETEGMMDSHALAISSARPGTVFLANRMGLFRSPDRGESWEEMGIGRFSPLTYARDVRVSPHDPGTMYAALSVAAISDEGSLYRSRDLGGSWQRFDHGVQMKSTLMIIAQSAAKAGRVWCATRKGQVFGTEDGGASWREHPLPEGGTGVYALAVG
ncbi:MAG: hypothetical protein KF889_13110 [Alphaproteobacteria bacterium]|nr:hypothetical protein [Alphaproteobacteria bacterium]MCW5739065.1 hypothetical protein [Alphaproteobacteria bacterium]